jgi:hypothetical protein
MKVDTYLGVLNGNIVQVFRSQEKFLRDRKRVHLYYAMIDGRMQGIVREVFNNALDNFKKQVR